MSIPRNPIYRPRRVEISLFASNTDVPLHTNREPNLRLELTEVSSIEFSSVSSLAIVSGAVASIIQPWYFQPIVLSITGRSYIGAFGRGAFGLRGTDILADQDISNMIRLREIVNQKFFSSFESIRNLIFRLVYEDPNDTENLAVSQTFRGFIHDISITEAETDPYVKVYRLKFTGEDERLLSILNGKDKAKEDQDQSIKHRGGNVDTDNQKQAKQAETDQTAEAPAPPPGRKDTQNEQGIPTKTETIKKPNEVQVLKTTYIANTGTQKVNKVEVLEVAPPSPTPSTGPVFVPLRRSVNVSKTPFSTPDSGTGVPTPAIPFP